MSSTVMHQHVPVAPVRSDVLDLDRLAQPRSRVAPPVQPRVGRLGRLTLIVKHLLGCRRQVRVFVLLLAM